MARWKEKYNIKKSTSKELNNRRLSVIQCETLCAQIANSVNNMPIGWGGGGGGGVR